MKDKPKYEELEQRIKEFETEAMEQKQMGEALRQSEERYRMLIDNSREAIFVVHDGELKFMNAVAIELTGISTDLSGNGQLTNNN